MEKPDRVMRCTCKCTECSSQFRFNRHQGPCWHLVWCTYQCHACGGGGEVGGGLPGAGHGVGIWLSLLAWGRAFDWSCSPSGGNIWIFLRLTWRYLTADSDEKDWDRTNVSGFHASCMRRTVWKDLEIMEAKRPTGTSENWVDFTVLSSDFVCFSVFLINWTSY